MCYEEKEREGIKGKGRLKKGRDLEGFNHSCS